MADKPLTKDELRAHTKKFADVMRTHPEVVLEMLNEFLKPEPYCLNIYWVNRPVGGDHAVT